MAIRRRGSDWTDAHIRAFWANYAANPYKSAQYFSKLVAAELVTLLRLTGTLRGRMLDYGCGPGYLLARLVEQPVECWGMDFSEESVRACEQLLGGRRNWHGAVAISSLPSPFPAASFDTVTCIETIEHLPDQHLTSTFLELRRLVAPGGSVVLTTPNAENLDAAMAYCPFCDSEFHHMQHVRSWTAESLRSALLSAGFSDVITNTVDLNELCLTPRKRRFWHPDILPRSLRARLGAWMDTVSRPTPGESRELSAFNRPGPHLYAIARP